MRILYRYTVVGRGAFPLDMLRRDQAWPATQEAIGNIFDEDVTRAVSITGTLPPTLARWESFGWNVRTPIEERILA
jgi:hypothetical protein